MSEFIIKKASKKAKKLRLGLSAASGFGKTYGALLLAKGLAKGDLTKVCLIDTERDSASLYADLGEFSTIRLDAPYNPERYINAIIAAEKAGFEVIIIDSITHEWDGEGGCLQIQSDLGGRYQDWARVTPRHNNFINKILTSPCHIITTVRRKQDHEITKDGNKTVVQKVGTKEVTRDGFEYELDINFEIINSNHQVKVSKDRTGLFIKAHEFLIVEETGTQILEWCNKGKSNLDEALEQIRVCDNKDSLSTLYRTYGTELKDNNDFIEAMKNKAKFIEDNVKQ